MPIICSGCFVVGIYADEFCAAFFGAEYRAAGTALRLMLPVIVMTLPNYLLGFPTLAPMGLTKHANLSTIVAAVFHICQLLLLWLFNSLNMESICVATCLTELVVLLYRMAVIMKNRKKLKIQTEKEAK